jgi:pimeloyl-ACP methyl ester carboxylesterase
MPTDTGPWRPRPGTLQWAAPLREPLGTIGLLHGVISSAGSWSRVGPALAARGWEVTAVDLPGHGEASRPKAPADPVAELVTGCMDALPERVDVLVGHSLGAVVALAIAGAHPRFARAVVLEDPPARSALDTELLASGLEALGQAVATDRAAYRRQLSASNPRWSDADVDQAVAALEACDTVEIARALRAGMWWDLPALLATVTCPVLLVAAPEVPGAIPIVQGTALLGAERRAVTDLLPPERFVVLDGGHSLHRELPDEMAGLIDRFASEVVG